MNKTNVMKQMAQRFSATGLFRRGQGCTALRGAAAGLLLLAGSAAQATDYTWNGPAYNSPLDKSWTNTVNWTPSGYPGTSEDVAVFNNTVQKTVNLNAGDSVSVGAWRALGTQNINVGGSGTLTLAPLGDVFSVTGKNWNVSCNVIPDDIPLSVTDGGITWASASGIRHIILTNSFANANQNKFFSNVLSRVDVYGLNNSFGIPYGGTMTATVNLYRATLQLGSGGGTPQTFKGHIKEQISPSDVTFIHGQRYASYTCSNDYSGVTLIKGNSVSTSQMASGEASIQVYGDHMFGSSDVTIYPDTSALRLRSTITNAIADTASLSLSTSIGTNCYIWIEAGVVEKIATLYVNGVKQPDGYYGSVTSAVINASLTVNTNFASYFPSYASNGPKVCSGLLHVKSPLPPGTMIMIY